MTRTMTRQWLVKASNAPFELPMGIALGLSLAFALTVMPEPLFDGYFAATGLPMLGLLGRVAASLGFGALGGWGTWRALVAAGPAEEKWQIKLPKESFTPRRADAHPDTPTRRPIFAKSELGPPMDSVAAASPRKRNPVPAGLPKPEIHLYPTPSGQPADDVIVPEVIVPEVIVPEPGVSEPAGAAIDAFDESEFLLDTPVVEAADHEAAAPVATPLTEAAPQAVQPPTPIVEAVPLAAAEAPVEQAPDAAPAYPVQRSQPSEQESIAALMLRLEQSLVNRPQPGATPSARAWLVPEDQDQEQRSARR